MTISKKESYFETKSKFKIDIIDKINNNAKLIIILSIIPDYSNDSSDEDDS